MIYSILGYWMPGPFEIIIILIPPLIAPVIGLLPTIFYILSLQKALNKCKVENRTMSPGSLWLYLIPFFNVFWHFVIVNSMAASLNKEFKSRQVQADPLPGKKLGLAMCILTACSMLPLIGLLTLLAAFICWICYWVKMVNYSELLAAEKAVA